MFFVLPSIFDLDKNIALSRATILVHCTMPHFGQRGVYAAYFEERLKNLYLQGKPYYSYKTKPNLYGKFTKCFPIDELEYEDKKVEAIRRFTAETKRDVQYQKTKLISQRNTLIKEMYLTQEMTPEQISLVLDPPLDLNEIKKIIRESNDKQL